MWMLLKVPYMSSTEAQTMMMMMMMMEVSRPPFRINNKMVFLVN